MDEGGWWCALQRSDQRDAVSVQRGRITSLSLSLSLSHLIISCTWTDARTCLLNLRSESHSFHRASRTRSPSGCKVRVWRGDIWTQLLSASSLRDGNMRWRGEKSSYLSMGRPWNHLEGMFRDDRKESSLFFFSLQFQAVNVCSVE